MKHGMQVLIFPSPTLVAHRINTILDSDRIVVLDHGQVKEFDTPAALVRSKGLFYELVRESGLLGQIDTSGSMDQ